MLFVIQGHVDKQRIERRNAYLIHCSMVEKPVSMLEYLPLPYDEELTADETGMSDAELYKLLHESGYFSTPLKPNNGG